ncbi:EF hand family protein [Tritrichomonas foetus]|uniref:EF hand family protein n=1 Tax=Tritrichomonas foetus TaxID=1144522 RepID=A0A1J4KIS2_9EUKA|nr:EF hand family protein [Tritrichomonas foetus]|eukprot:OHT10832.1 EF hand family protein [Tritrichomonas foetus]
MKSSRAISLNIDNDNEEKEIDDMIILVTSRTRSSVKPLKTSREKSEEITGRRFLLELRRVFDDADTEGKGYLTEEQWNASSLRHYIQDGKMTDEEFQKYFMRIDANAEGQLSWSSLVQYLIKEISVNDLHIDNETIRFIHKPKLPTPPRSLWHREMITHASICYGTGEYVTMSPDSIRFWSPSDLSFIRSITEPGYFSNFCVFDNQKLIVVSSTKRQLLFYELESLTKLPIEISASPTTKQIKTMAIKQAEDALRVLDSPHMPLGNVPTALCNADSLMKPNDYNIIFFVGDDSGIIEVYKLNVPMRRRGTDFSVTRIGRTTLHDGGVNQIAPIDILNCYASCSMDHTVKFWNFLDSTVKDQGSFTVLRTFTDHSPIIGFNFSPTQKVIVTYGVSRDGTVWGVSPPRKLFKLGGHYNTVQAVTDFVTTTNEKYLCTMTNRKEFRLWDSVNFRMVYEWTDPTLQRPENHYSVAMFDYVRHSLITCSSYPSKWAEDVTSNVDLYEIHTHSYPIVGMFYSKEFDQLLTVDSICTFKLWNFREGKLASQRKVLWDENMSNLSSACIDCSNRRLITSTFNCRTSLWNFNSGTEIPILNLLPPTNFVNVMKWVIIAPREYLVRSCWDKTIMLFSEVEKGNFELYRTYNGHKNDITDIVAFNNGLVSGDVAGQIFEWILDTNTPQGMYKINSSVECLLASGNYLFIGDGEGKLHVLTLPKLLPILSVSAHDLSKPYILSSIVIDEENHFLYTADTFGYVRKWKLTLDIFSITPLVIKRCSIVEITSLLLLEDGQFLATCGTDKIIRMWGTENFEYYGFFHDDSKWTLGDETTVLPEPYELEKTHFEKPTVIPNGKSKRSFRSFTMNSRSNNQKMANDQQAQITANSSKSNFVTLSSNVSNKNNPSNSKFDIQTNQQFNKSAYHSTQNSSYHSTQNSAFSSAQNSSIKFSLSNSNSNASLSLNNESSSKLNSSLSIMDKNLSLNGTIPEQDENTEEEAFSFTLAGKLINDFMTDQEYKRNRINPDTINIIEERLISAFTYTHPKQLQTTARPQDIISNYHTLTSRPVSAVGEPKSPTTTSARAPQYVSALAKPIFRPITKKNRRAASTNRVRLSANLF